VARSGITIPAHLVAAVAEVPYGAHPSSCYPRYAYDRAHLRDYVSAAESGRDGLEKYLAAYVGGSEEDYREAVGAGRLTALAGWAQSVTGWQELFR
jgi:glutaconate CoA-transferase, subunit A